jgi:hypothetical protein
MPPRRLAKTGQKHEMEAFAEKYDTLASSTATRWRRFSPS